MTTRLQDLQKQLSSMTPEEKLEHIRIIRADRIIPKAKLIKQVKKSKKSSEKIKETVATLSEEERLKLIAMLENEV